ncbi:hypothetical protein S83_064135 [Arachis hypogaea]
MLWHSIFFLFNWNLFYYHVSLQDDIRIVPKLRYDIPRHQVKQVICSLCGTEQEVSKKQYHCGGCGICRTGGSENCFHRDKCDVKDSPRDNVGKLRGELEPEGTSDTVHVLGFEATGIGWSSLVCTLSSMFACLRVSSSIGFPASTDHTWTNPQRIHRHHRKSIGVAILRSCRAQRL